MGKIFIRENLIRSTPKIAGKEILTLIDVRTKREYSMGHIETAINIPIDELRENINKLDKKSNIIVYCATSYRSYLAYRILANKGFENIKRFSWEKAAIKILEIYERLN